MSRFSSIYYGAAVLFLGLCPVAYAQELNEPVELSLDRIVMANTEENEDIDDIFDNLRRRNEAEGKDTEILLGGEGLVLRDLSVTVGYTANYYTVLKRGKEYWADSMGHYGFAEIKLHIGTWNYARFEGGAKLFAEGGWFHLTGDGARYSSRRRMVGGQLFASIADAYETKDDPSWGRIQLGVSVAHNRDKGRVGRSTGNYSQRYDAMTLGVEGEISINFPMRGVITPDNSHRVIVRNNWRQTVFTGWFPKLRIAGEFMREVSVHGRTSLGDGRQRNTRYAVMADAHIIRVANDTTDVKQKPLRLLDALVRLQHTGATAYGYRSQRDGSFTNTFGGGPGLQFSQTHEHLTFGLSLQSVVSYENRGISHSYGANRVVGVGSFSFYVNF
jgi:hypothetical protein